ncbi:hypothetical protein P691DRAFT_777810 [Macrolepiota fuliginosa MF-IS2]|uniref:Beta-lactamase-related domain-containing protein n=1 Tax=Macrolepiota fuliginosa MF-IS2 TaxID=1400762 RepID=A0A9P6BYG1_9AGAR|nr:hypothetical protein P691DRAFT_777810 [Macrolepiota fuliginosa MF-IS2]
MSTATYSIATAEGGFLADGFQLSGQDLKRSLDGVKKAIVPLFKRPGEEDGIAGSGGVIASARDLVTWVSMLLALGRHPHRNEQIIPAEVIKHTATGASTIPTNVFNGFPEMSVSVYGTGQQIFSYPGHEIVEHDGNVLGFSSEIIRLPDDNLGIVLLNNDWVSNIALDVIKWRLIDELIVRAALPGSPFIDWVSRYKAIEETVKEERKMFTPRPKHPALPTLAFPELQKRLYSHPTYGTLKLCFVLYSPSLPETWTERPFVEISADCPRLISSLPVQRILDISDPAIPTLIIPFKSAFTTHIRLTHFSGDVFNATAIWTNADTRLKEGLGSVDENGQWTDDGDVVIPIQDFVAEWFAQGEEEGLAFKGNFWGMGVGARAPLGSGKETAEAWFSRTRGSGSDQVALY